MDSFQTEFGSSVGSTSVAAALAFGTMGAAGATATSAAIFVDGSVGTDADVAVLPPVVLIAVLAANSVVALERGSLRSRKSIAYVTAMAFAAMPSVGDSAATASAVPAALFSKG